MEKLFLPHVWFSTDMKKEFYQAWKYQPPPPLL
jgi:hypothetical protein